MGSFRSGRGGRGGRNQRGGGGREGDRGGDFRWRKGTEKRKREVPLLHESGDSIYGDDFTTPPATGDVVGGGQKSKEGKASIKERQRKAKRRRREMHDLERETTDAMIHTAPEKFLWEKYVDWVGVKLSNAEKKAEKWAKEQVCTVEEREGASLIDGIKEVVGPDYISQGGWKKKAVALPGVACVVLASSAVRAVQLAKSVYDGRPVGKLFSKHIKIEEQRKWLSTCCSNGLAPSAAGTAKRVQRLIEDSNMTLTHTVALVIDLNRDRNLRNIIDFDHSREELFEFLFNHARPFVNEGKMKIILYAAKKATEFEENNEKSDDEVKDEEVE